VLYTFLKTALVDKRSGLDDLRYIEYI